MTSELSVCFVDYKDLKILDDNQIEFLSDIQYAHSDIVVTPILSRLTRKLTEDELLNSFITIQHFRMSRQFLESIIKNYLSKNITSFVIDFDGMTVDKNESWMRKLFRLLKDNNLLEESFLYSINANTSKFMKQTDEILAKDFICGDFGVDILGLNHVPPRMPSELWNKIKQQRRENIFRVFNRNSYGYSKRTETEQKNRRKNNWDDVCKFNIAEQFEESKTLQLKLKEENSIESYIRTKSQVTKNIIKQIKKIRKCID